jgi:hypothetical protein
MEETQNENADSASTPINGTKRKYVRQATHQTNKGIQPIAPESNTKVLSTSTRNLIDD